MIESTPKFLQSVARFQGRGYETPIPLDDALTYIVPSDKRAQTIYFRAGNASNELVYFALMRDGKLMRYFPVGAKACVHVPLAVVEDIAPESKLELLLAAPAGLTGTVIIDLGLVEI